MSSKPAGFSRPSARLAKTKKPPDSSGFLKVLNDGV
jgi:hypothetical protein